MKKIISKVLVGIFLLSPLALAGHPQKFKEKLEEPVDTGTEPRKNESNIDKELFAESLTDFFSNRRQLLPEEIKNQYTVFLTQPEHKYWRWAVTLSNNLISKDLYSAIFLFSRNDAIELLSDKPNGTGLLRAVYHDKGSIAITYVEDKTIKHALLDVSSLNNYSLRNVLFCKKLSFMDHIIVRGHFFDNQPTYISLPIALLSYPVDRNLVSEIN